MAKDDDLTRRALEHDRCTDAVELERTMNNAAAKGN